MKKGYILGVALLSSAVFMAVQSSNIGTIDSFMTKNGHNINAGGSQPGKTGAPGEGANGCAVCHGGGTQDGANVNDLKLFENLDQKTEYTPGVAYSVVLTLNDEDVKEGFQATVLDPNETMAGTFTGANGLGTNITSANGRDYANHTANSNTSANASWVWEWEAPSTDVGPVKFYVATNIANGNGTTSGDAIYLSEHTFNSAGGAGIEELNEMTDFTAGYASIENKVLVNFSSKSIGAMFFNLVDLSGKSVFTSHLGESQLGENQLGVVLPSEVKSGIYIVNFFIGNKAMSEKILIQK